MKLFSKKAQSILEYTLILGVVIGAIILVLFSGIGGHSIKSSVEDAYDDTADALNNTVDDLTHGVFQGN
jgi:uncharacterized protein (UPF0333 family)